MVARYSVCSEMLWAVVCVCVWGVWGGVGYVWGVVVCMCVGRVKCNEAGRPQAGGECRGRRAPGSAVRVHRRQVGGSGRKTKGASTELVVGVWG